MKRQSILGVDVWTALLAVAAASCVVQLLRPERALAGVPLPRPMSDELKAVYASGSAFGRSEEVKLRLAMPGQVIVHRLEVLVSDSVPVFYEWTSLRGIETALSAQPLDDSTVTTPTAPGFYYLTLVRGAARQIVTEPVVAVLRPFEEKTGTMLNGYRIGTYIAEKLLRNRTKECPDGFLEIYPQHVDLPLSKHFRVRDFITRDDQAHVWPKYVALNPRLLDKLELVFAELEKRRDHGARQRKGDLRLDMHSGFRTPSHNKRIRRAARDSRHQYGDAADIGVDANWNGRIDRTDWRSLVIAVEAVEKSHPDLVGGLGIYNSRRVSSPYVHIDVRGTRSRWKG
jgi:uncharacterized protein YcbK (DUF882 family)